MNWAAIEARQLPVHDCVGCGQPVPRATSVSQRFCGCPWSLQVQVRRALALGGADWQAPAGRRP